MNPQDATSFAEIGIDKAQFFKIVEAEHLRIAPCFMTGKGCVYAEAIDAEISKRRKNGQLTGFMVMPFRPNLNIFHNLTLRRFLAVNYSAGHFDETSSIRNSEPAQDPRVNTHGCLTLVRADQVSQTGFVICKKICKKIQDSDFVIADISMPNANVFYELGLAYGLRHKIVLIHHRASHFGQDAASYFGANSYKYNDLKLIKSNDFLMSSHVWRQESKSTVPDESPNILVLDLYPQDNMDTSVDDIPLSFHTHVEAAIGVCVVDVHAQLKQERHPMIDIYGMQIEGLATATSILAEEKKSFSDVRTAINRAFCTVIRTGGGQTCDPMAYFWLGYCHSIGKNVIPVTVVDHLKDPVHDLAFDIRALWHMRFAKSEPTTFVSELKDALRQMIESDFSEWSRKAFWNEITGKRGEVSIFTGALHNEALEREMTGDWDLRAVSELTSYLAGHQYRAKLESPVYQPRFEKGNVETRQSYINALKKLLEDKNCVLIASPDVNPLTEIALGALYGVPEDNWFDPDYDLKSTPGFVRAVKMRPAKSGGQNRSHYIGRTFYKELESNDESHWRGFETSIVSSIQPERFFLQSDVREDFKTYAHLVIAPNPFRSAGTLNDKKFLIILNGIGGPATFALTHVLTGGVNDDWAAYRSDFNCHSRSEDDLRGINLELSRLDVIGVGLQYIFQVDIGSPSTLKDKNTASRESIAKPSREELPTYDMRRVKGWQILESMNAQFRTLRARQFHRRSIMEGV